MPRVATRLAVLVVALAALFPVLALGKTPEPATPAPGSDPAFTLTLIGEVVSEDGAGDLQLWTLETGPIGPVGQVSGSQVVMHVQSGEVIVTPVDGVATVTVGNGAPIVSPDGENLCAADACELASGQQAALGPGNGFSAANVTFTLHVTADEGAVAQIGTVASSAAELCWICPITG